MIHDALIVAASSLAGKTLNVVLELFLVAVDVWNLQLVHEHLIVFQDNCLKKTILLLLLFLLLL
jgi:hypothetical protein